MQGIFSSSITIDPQKKAVNSANGVYGCTLKYIDKNGNEKLVQGHYKAISDTYPPRLAINEILMLADYQLVLGKKVAIKTPVFDEQGKLVGVFSKNIENFKNMSESELTADELIERGFIETLWACYFRMENDLHPDNITNYAALYDADKSNYPEIIKWYGQRYMERLFWRSSDFPITPNVIKYFPDVAKANISGPCFWPTFAVPENCNIRKTYNNIAEFLKLNDNPETRDRVFSTMLKDLKITPQQRLTAYIRALPNELEIKSPDSIKKIKVSYLDADINKTVETYLETFTERTKALKEVLLNDEELRLQLTQFIKEKEPNSAKILFELHEADLAKIIKKLYIFQSHPSQGFVNKINLLTKNFIARLAQYSKTDFSTSIFKYSQDLLGELTNIIEYCSIDPIVSPPVNNKCYTVTDSEMKFLINFEQLIKKKIAMVTSPLQQANTTNQRDSFFKPSIQEKLAFEVSEFEDPQTLLSCLEKLEVQIKKENQHNACQDNLPKLYQYTLAEAIGEAFYTWINESENNEFVNNELLLKAVNDGYKSYYHRPTGYLGFLVGAKTRSNTFETNIKNPNFNFPFDAFMDAVKGYGFEVGYTSSSCNNYVFEEVFKYIKQDLRDLNAISLAAKYPALSDFSQKEIEAFDAHKKAEDIATYLQNRLDACPKNAEEQLSSKVASRYTR